MKRQSLKMKAADWFYLQELAADTGSLYSGKASWRRLVARIARGELLVSLAPPQLVAASPSPCPAPLPPLQKIKLSANDAALQKVIFNDVFKELGL